MEMLAPLFFTERVKKLDVQNWGFPRGLRERERKGGPFPVSSFGQGYFERNSRSRVRILGISGPFSQQISCL
jgi:hypothetical protein